MTTAKILVRIQRPEGRPPAIACRPLGARRVSRSFIVFDVIDDGGIDGPGCVDVEARLPAPCRPIVAEADERPCLTYADLHDEGAGKAIDIHRHMVTEETSRRAHLPHSAR